jgi:hypothetical protein
MYDMGSDWTRLPDTDTLPPYSGNSFITNTFGKLIPEYYIEPGSVNFLDGAEIYEFSSDGVGRLVAIYKYNEGWVTI